MSIDKRFEMCEQLLELQDKIGKPFVEKEETKKRMKTLKSKIQRYDEIKQEEENKTVDNIQKQLNTYYDIKYNSSCDIHIKCR